VADDEEPASTPPAVLKKRKKRDRVQGSVIQRVAFLPEAPTDTIRAEEAKRAMRLSDGHEEVLGPQLAVPLSAPKYNLTSSPNLAASSSIAVEVGFCRLCITSQTVISVVFFVSAAFHLSPPTPFPLALITYFIPSIHIPDGGHISN